MPNYAKHLIDENHTFDENRKINERHKVYYLVTLKTNKLKTSVFCSSIIREQFTVWLNPDNNRAVLQVILHLFPKIPTITLVGLILL